MIRRRLFVFTVTIGASIGFMWAGLVDNPRADYALAAGCALVAALVIVTTRRIESP